MDFLNRLIMEIPGMNAAAEEKLPGSYEIEFSSKITGGKQINLSSGVYFYSLQSEEFYSTKKFIFLK
ncbi:MAG: hypothetical protein ACM34J_16250 [Ignavibacteria bacterium]